MLPEGTVGRAAVDAACGGADAADADADGRDGRRELLLAMVDHPLRVLAACAQIGVGMWRRNGMGALSQLVNYASPPLCTRLRDLDLTMLQYALATLDGADVLAAILLRFGWLDQALAAAAGEEAANALRSSVSAGGRSLLEGHEALTAMDVTSESAVRGRLLEDCL